MLTELSTVQLYDTYITNFKNAEQFTYEYFPFFDHAYRVLRTGGIFTYYSSEVSEFSPVHLQALQTAGFSDIQKKICKISPPDDCLYWKNKTMIAPIIRK
ncbi:methyltransferase domain-containing protein [Desulfonema magnum]|uniref:Methyltransferase domain-containing protein n=1 Tax=Desulfonema magnum TaxID=45655 RepID=A0A975BLT9_9BACT|nr:methyltransferase domain-containing protein [Desulfonema magnum]